MELKHEAPQALDLKAKMKSILTADKKLQATPEQRSITTWDEVLLEALLCRRKLKTERKHWSDRVGRLRHEIGAIQADSIRFPLLLEDLREARNRLAQIDHDLIETQSLIEKHIWRLKVLLEQIEDES